MTAVVVAGILTQKILGVIEQPSITVGVLSQGLTINNIISGGSGGDTATKIANETLGGHRVVASNGSTGVLYADKDTLGDLPIVLGITSGAANNGDPVDIVLRGDMTEGSWSWTPNEFVYLGTNGALTQATPSSGFLLVIGTAIAPTVLNVRLGVPIKLT